MSVSQDASTMGEGRQATVQRMRLGFFKRGVVQILIAVACGIVLGRWHPALAVEMKPLSDGFVRLIGMPISLLVFALVVSGIAGMRSQTQAAKIGGKALLYFALMTLLSLLVGVVAALLLHPGNDLEPGFALEELSSLTSSSEYFFAQWQQWQFSEAMLETIPSSFFGAFVEGDIQQVLLLALLFGVALAWSGERGAPIRQMIELLLELLFSLMNLVLKLAPLAAFGAIAFTIGKYGIGSMVPLLKFVATLYLASAAFILLVLALVSQLAGVSLWRLLLYVKDELVLVLFTTSSIAALPGLIARMERLGCSPAVVRLVLPAGYSFNLNGTNLYLAVAVIFLAQVQEIPLSLGQLVMLVLVASLTSKGATGVTGSAFVALAATLSALPFMPTEGMVLLLGVERLMKCRSLTNAIGNCVACVAIARWDNALDREVMRRELKAPFSAGPIAPD
ncbi:cation:dicarboxylate symporter family transporter [Pseudomonas agarici]|uniref:cation:dicarboxylate symporter family transporter n=1 Tax=Pseudomonas agarici TaxID=46677 RepID=UPI0034E94388